MLGHHRTPLACLLLIALGAAACSAKLGEDSAGDNGTLRFQYSDGNGCLLGCSLDRSALQGSQVSISAKSSDADVRMTARLSDASVGRISSQSQSCSCRSSSRSRSVTPNEKCTSVETRECSLAIDIETNRPGDATLEIYDTSDKVLDRVTMHVRPAARIDVDVRQGGKKIDDDQWEVREGFKVKLESSVFDEAGTEMIFARHGVSFDYADKSLVQPDSAVLVGSTDVEDMIAGSRAGDTSVTVKAAGTSKVVRFRVVP